MELLWPEGKAGLASSAGEAALLPKKDENLELLESGTALVLAGEEEGSGTTCFGLTNEKKLSTSLALGWFTGSSYSSSFLRLSSSLMCCFQRSKSSTVSPISILRSCDISRDSHSGTPSSADSPKSCEIFSVDIESMSEDFKKPAGLRSHERWLD